MNVDIHIEGVDFKAIAEVARRIILECTKDNPSVKNLFNTDIGFKLILSSVYKVAELASKKVKNLKKSQVFASWFMVEYEDRVGTLAPDKICNLVREICVNLLTPYKKLFWN